uniref:SUZ-C domain-containing protein n=1 Tax=Meleagris gallopavo TaxID=9103 RepID=A0A803XPA1_MELGA
DPFTPRFDPQTDPFWDPPKPLLQDPMKPPGAAGSRAMQATRAALRRRFLLSLAAARGQRVTFILCQHGRVGAVGGNDGGAAAAFQVDALQTPLGVQRAALLRGRDVVAFGFQVAEK